MPHYDALAPVARSTPVALPGASPATGPFPHGAYPPPPGVFPQPPEVASWGRRVAAFLIDSVLAQVLTFGVILIGALVAALVDNIAYPEYIHSDTMSPAAITIVLTALFAAFATAIAYWSLPHAKWGKTIGKWMLGIRVIAANTGTPPSVGRALGRYFFFALLSFPMITFFVDCLWPLWDSRGQSLHDKVAGTYVIRG